MTDNINERNIWVSFLYICPLISECCTNGYNNWFQHRLRVGSMKTASILLSLPREIQAGWGCFPLYGVGQQRIWLTTLGQFSAVWKPCLLKFKDVCGENNPGMLQGHTHESLHDPLQLTCRVELTHRSKAGSVLNEQHQNTGIWSGKCLSSLYNYLGSTTCDVFDAQFKLHKFWRSWPPGAHPVNLNYDFFGYSYTSE